MSLPTEVMNISQWTHSHSVGELKRPKHSDYRPGKCLSFSEVERIVAASHGVLRMGFYVTDEDPYILGDIDHLSDPMDKEAVASELPIEFANLLFNKGLYSEVSPSGKGIRFIAKLPDVATKQSLTGQYFKNKFEMEMDPESGLRRESQINIGRPWQTITCNETPYSSGKVGVLQLEDIEDLYKLKFKSDDPLDDVDQIPDDETDEKLPSTNEVLERLRMLPWDHNPRLMRAYRIIFGEEYTPYEYWLKVLMALSDFVSKSPNKNMDQVLCLEELDKWSAKDKERYKGPQDIANKWKSFQRKENKISYHTLFALSHAITLRWPVAKLPSAKQKEAGITDPIPIVTEYKNFLALINFYDLKLHRDTHTSTKVYISGDEDVTKRYFTHMDVEGHYDKYHGPWEEKSLIAKLHIMCQDHGMIGISHPVVKQHVINWLSQMSREIDLVLKFFDTPFEKLPARYQENKQFRPVTDIDYIFSCLDINFQTPDRARELSLYKKYYKSWLMGIPRGLYKMWKDHMNNCILLLTGPEQVYKTTHFKRLLPRFLREQQVGFTPHGFSTEAAVRDVTKLAAACTVLVWDEIEQYLNAETESNFKKLLDNNPIQVIDKYNTLASYIRPVAIYGATSNKNQFRLSDSGNRRIFHIPVNKVDTNKLDTVNWWVLINDLRDEMLAHKGPLPPWLLSEEELQFQAILHGNIKAKNELDIMLEEVFDLETPFDPELDANGDIIGYDFRTSERLKTLTDVVPIINRMPNSMGKVRRPAMQRSLRRILGQWTGTMRTPKQFSGRNTQVLRQGEVQYDGRVKYILPETKVRTQW